MPHKNRDKRTYTNKPSFMNTFTFLHLTIRILYTTTLSYNPRFTISIYSSLEKASLTEELYQVDSNVSCNKIHHLTLNTGVCHIYETKNGDFLTAARFALLQNNFKRTRCNYVFVVVSTQLPIYRYSVLNFGKDIHCECSLTCQISNSWINRKKLTIFHHSSSILFFQMKIVSYRIICDCE